MERQRGSESDLMRLMDWRSPQPLRRSTADVRAWDTHGRLSLGDSSDDSLDVAEIGLCAAVTDELARLIAHQGSVATGASVPRMGVGLILRRLPARNSTEQGPRG